MIPFEEWCASDQHRLRQMARDPELKPLKFRVMFAAEGWANLIGHAEFAPGGLGLVLQSANPRTGELRIPSKTTIAHAIKEAIDLGLIGKESTARCLVADPDKFAKSGGHGGKTCRTHGLNARPRRGVNR